MSDDSHQDGISPIYRNLNRSTEQAFGYVLIGLIVGSMAHGCMGVDLPASSSGRNRTNFTSATTPHHFSDVRLGRALRDDDRMDVLHQGVRTPHPARAARTLDGIGPGLWCLGVTAFLWGGARHAVIWSMAISVLLFVAFRRGRCNALATLPRRPAAGHRGRSLDGDPRGPVESRLPPLPSWVSSLDSPRALDGRHPSAMAAAGIEACATAHAADSRCGRRPRSPDEGDHALLLLGMTAYIAGVSLGEATDPAARAKTAGLPRSSRRPCCRLSGAYRRGLPGFGRRCRIGHRDVVACILPSGADPVREDGFERHPAVRFPGFRRYDPGQSCRVGRDPRIRSGPLGPVVRRTDGRARSSVRAEPPSRRLDRWFSDGDGRDRAARLLDRDGSGTGKMP